MIFIYSGENFTFGISPQLDSVKIGQRPEESTLQLHDGLMSFYWKFMNLIHSMERCNFILKRNTFFSFSFFRVTLGLGDLT